MLSERQYASLELYDKIRHDTTKYEDDTTQKYDIAFLPFVSSSYSSTVVFFGIFGIFEIILNLPTIRDDTKHRKTMSYFCRIVIRNV